MDSEHTTNAIAWSHNGSKIAIASFKVGLSDDGEYHYLDPLVQIVDTSTQIITPTIKFQFPVVTLVWGNNDSKLVSAQLDGSIQQWDTKTGSLIASFFEPHAVAISLHPRTGELATGSLDNFVRVRDATGHLLQSLDLGRPVDWGSSQGTNWIGYSPDGKLLATSNYDGILRIFDATTLNPIKILAGHTAAIVEAAWSPCGTKLISGSQDTTARIWDWKNQHSLHVLEHNGFVQSVSWSSDGTKIATGCSNGTINIWDAKNGAPVRTIKTKYKKVYVVDWGIANKLAYSGVKSDNSDEDFVILHISD